MLAESQRFREQQLALNGCCEQEAAPSAENRTACLSIGTPRDRDILGEDCEEVEEVHNLIPLRPIVGPERGGDQT